MRFGTWASPIMPSAGWMWRGGSRARLEESVRLRREIGFLPGVAANLVGLAYIAAGQGRRDEALSLLAEAGAVAESSGADGILRHVEEARAQISPV